MEVIKLKTDSLAHLSYVVIDQDEALVIDPMRDAEQYFKIAQKKGATIKYIFETHRNEDFVTGSRELNRLTHAPIYHGKGLNFKFGEFVSEGDSFQVGNAVLKILETPGHTPESISLVLYATESDPPLGVFTGDALFIGDVGRTDFFKDQMEEYAGMLYDSIHEKILPLGDQVILYPAHGAGSVCGGDIANREISTLGYEKKNNLKLQLAREDFISAKVQEKHMMPPYFHQMEEVNLLGNDKALRNYEKMDAINPIFIKENLKSIQLVDTRPIESFLGCHIPGSLSLPTSMIGAYGGYLINYEQNIILVGESLDDIKKAKIEFERMGYDNVKGFLQGGVATWETTGEALGNIPAVDYNYVEEMIRDNKNQNIFLDVRKPNEWESGTIPRARTLFLGDLPRHAKEFSSAKEVVVYCSSGKRSAIGASILAMQGMTNIKVFMGSMQAYNNRAI